MSARIIDKDIRFHSLNRPKGAHFGVMAVRMGQVELLTPQFVPWMDSEEAVMQTAQEKLKERPDMTALLDGWLLTAFRIDTSKIIKQIDVERIRVGAD